MDSERVNLLDLTVSGAEDVLRRFCAERGLPEYRAKQVLRRLWSNPPPYFEGMTELPKSLRSQLAEAFVFPRLSIAARQRSSDGTEKFLFMLGDGQAIKSVAIPENDRLTLCISSQAGCALQ